MEHNSASSPRDASRLLVSVPSAEIAYFHAILEGYDDLAAMRTLSPEDGLVEVCVSPGRKEEFLLLLGALRREGIDVGEVRE